MTTSVLASLVIVGVAVSLLVQYLKQHFGGGYKTQLILLALSLVAGVIYYFAQIYPVVWQTTLGILATADIVYSFVLRYFESPTPPPSNPNPQP